MRRVVPPEPSDETARSLSQEPSTAGRVKGGPTFVAVGLLGHVGARLSQALAVINASVADSSADAQTAADWWQSRPYRK